ncbi:solute carrier family 22 member 21-like isoform X2 [Sipha flava]|uniref:Solute carrier family 22 member 21-like isoform X2 n=1 Tax=Sipha flava TaxID=143950 RepID=A0A8B8GCZ2_9HEMI|nr:solute carrier family 22 member 21-like isoform X2 [Sipha flava]
MSPTNLDNVLVSLGIGRYQFVGCLLFGLMIMYSNVSPIAYIFTSGDLKYRCEIPECDPLAQAERTYQPDWLRYTTPFREDTGLPKKCLRYATVTDRSGNGTQCAPDIFDGQVTEHCGDQWVFENYENTIGTEFGLMCEENKWKLSMVGTINNFGQFIGIPMSGIIADKMVEESMRWLEMQGKHERVIHALQVISGINKKPLPEIHLTTRTKATKSIDDTGYIRILKDVIHSPTLLWRMIKCSSIWIGITMVFFGLTISATDIAGDKYLNFTLVSLVEIPACLLNWMVMEGFSRKMSLSCMLVLSGATCVAYNLTSSDYFFVKLSLFLISKLGISVAFVIVYLLTVEIFPTRMRVSLLSICSMIGRIGSMLAPQITLLGDYFGEFVVMPVFGITALTAAVVTMTMPESKNIKLPDTVDEAERIGTTRQLLPENVNSA